MSATHQGLPRKCYFFARILTDMGHSLLFNRRPKNASCGWVYNAMSAPIYKTSWWVGGLNLINYPGNTNISAACFASKEFGLLSIYCSTDFNISSSVFTPGNSYGTLAGGSCGSLYQYVSRRTGSGYFLYTIDVWKALQDGFWTSSFTVDIRLSTGGSATMLCGNYGSAQGNPFVQSTKTISYFYDTCVSPGPADWTLTVYDDGTLNLS